MPIDLRARTALVLLAVGLSFAPVVVVQAATAGVVATQAATRAGGAATEASGELRRFDQSAHAPGDVDPLLADEGLLYVPAACAGGWRS